MRLFLCGDVMTGRGIDQIMSHCCDPVLYESYVRSATGYVQLAERRSGPIPRQVPFDYIWGDAPAAFDQYQPDFRIINLETSITDRCKLVKAGALPGARRDRKAAIPPSL